MTTATKLSYTQIQEMLKDAVPGQTLLHVCYDRMAGAKTTERQKEEASKAKGLGLAQNRYTGRFEGLKECKDGTHLLQMSIFLERENSENPEQLPFRAFNIEKGAVKVLQPMGMGGPVPSGTEFPEKDRLIIS